MVKPSNVTLASKYFETGITSLLAADNQNSECASVKSPADLFNKGKMFLLKYLSHINITIDPESRSDGIFWPRMSMVMDGHCKTALLSTCCLVSKDTAWFVRVQKISSNLAAGMEDDSGSTLTPPLHPWPWEAGVFSLTCCSVAVDELGMPPWLVA